MSKSTTSVSKVEQTHQIALITFSSAKEFDSVVLDFEKQLGRFDEARAKSSDDLHSAVKQMAGPSGLMILTVLDMDKTLPALRSSPTRARQYLVGNPLIASKMAQHHVLAAFYAPPRVLVYTAQGKTCISYDKPSTAFGTLSLPQIVEVAADLDSKFEQLATTALG
jgi:uncharacterized protein (DUF302 family)